MRIAIFGDSFGCHVDGWPNHLGNLLKCKVDTYAEGGTSIDYSYFNFIKSHEKYDKIIFLWTNTIRSSLIVSKEQDDFVHVAEYHYHHDKKYNRKYNNTKFEKGPTNNGKHINKNSVWQKQDINVEKYFLSEQTLSNSALPWYFNTLKHKAMKDSVMLHRPDCINIRCFDEYYNGINFYGINNIPMSDFKNIFGKDVRFNGADDPYIRRNHLSKTQNREFAEYLAKHITDNSFDIHDTVTPEDVKKYYTMSSDKEDHGFR